MNSVLYENDLFNKNKFDELDKEYINNNVKSLFKKEEELINKLNIVKKKKRNIDYLKVEYNTFKKNIEEELSRTTNNLKKINKISKYFINDKSKNDSFLFYEYKLLLITTSTNNYLKIIEEIKLKINQICNNISNKDIITLEKEIKKDYQYILIFINADNDEYNSKNISFKEFLNNKKFYYKEIENLLYKKKLFTSYIDKLEFLYYTIINFKMSTLIK